MTAREVIESLLDESGYQVAACLKDLDEATFTAKPIASMFSIRETVEHLVECCIALQKTARGEKHDWGTYRLPEGDFANSIETYVAEREKAVSVGLEKLESDFHLVKDFLIAHEFYHVGQLCAVRLSLNPEWNAYSIYRF